MVGKTSDIMTEVIKAPAFLVLALVVLIIFLSLLISFFFDLFLVRGTCTYILTGMFNSASLLSSLAGGGVTKTALTAACNLIPF